MAFSKKTWLQRIVEYPSRRRLNETGTQSTYDVSRAEGDVIQEGDGFTVKNMNDLEERISRAFKEQGYYGTCNTAAATAAKTATIDGFVLEEGSRVLLKMTAKNTAENPTLNITGTGDIAICIDGTTPVPIYYWKDGESVEFVYDGTYWRCLKPAIAGAKSWGITKLSDTYATEIENGNATHGIGASQNALYNCYRELCTNIELWREKTIQNAYNSTKTIKTFTAPRDGFYNIIGSVLFNASANGLRGVSITIGDMPPIINQRLDTSATYNTVIPIAYLGYIKNGTVVTISASVVGSSAAVAVTPDISCYN